jgi:hypothetical protein
MKIPLIIASDFSGFIPGMLFFTVPIILTPVLIITVYLALMKRESVWKVLRVGRFLAITQVVAIGWYILAVPRYRLMGEGLLEVLYFLVPSILLGIAAFLLRQRRSEPNLEGCVRPERSGAVNTTIVEQARGEPETKPQSAKD